MIRNRIIAVFGAFLCGLSLSAQSVHWSVPPVYTAVEPLSNQWVRVNKGGAWGILDVTGKEVVPCAYGQITPFKEGYSLLLRGEKLFGVFSRDGAYRTIQDDLFVDPSFPYFSEGLLAVRDVSSSWTYMTPEGSFPIRMVFQYAGPFSNGLAAVREKGGEGSYLHIDKKGRVSILSSDYPDNFLVFASSFTDLNGQAGALVVDGHSQVSIRSLGGAKLMDFGKMKSFNKETMVLTTKEYEIALSEGRFIRSRKRLSDADVREYYTDPVRRFNPASTTSLTIKREGERLGVTQHEKVLLEPQFESLQVLSESRLLATKNGMMGVLAIEENEQAPGLQLSKNTLVVRHPADLVLSGQVVLPASIPFSDVHLKMQETSGVSQEFALDKASFSIPVVHLVKDQALDLKVVISANGLTYPPVRTTIPVEYSSAFSVEAPSSITLQPGNEKAAFSMHIKNRADVPASACDILVDGRFIMAVEGINAGEQINVPLSFQVSLEDLDSISRDIKVEIREKDIPASYKTRIQVTFNRNFN